MTLFDHHRHEQHYQSLPTARRFLSMLAAALSLPTPGVSPLTMAIPERRTRPDFLAKLGARRAGCQSRHGRLKSLPPA